MSKQTKTEARTMAEKNETKLYRFEDVTGKQYTMRETDEDAAGHEILYRNPTVKRIKLIEVTP